MKYFKAVMIVVLSMSFAGCAAIGLSTKALRENKDKEIKIFDRNISYCYDKASEAVKKWKAVSFFQVRGRYIVAVHLENVYASCVDTTEVGIFFKELEPNKTEISVSSLNHKLSKFVSEYLFKYIENPEAPTCPILQKKEKQNTKYTRKL